MSHIKEGLVGRLFHKFLLNLPYLTIILVGLLFVLNIAFYKKESIEYSDILLDKTFEDVNEIYINNEFGKSFILEVPQRSRIIVQKKDGGNSQTNVIKIDILK